MSKDDPLLDRRAALRTAAGISLAGLAGCLDGSDPTGTPGNGNTAPDGQGIFERIAIEGTTLVVELTEDAEVDQINLIQPNGELFGEREVATGAKRVSFEIGTSYESGEYRIVALTDEDNIGETSLSIQPRLEIKDIGLYRNQPNKPWEDVYGESKTDSKKNGEAFVTVKNAGSGPDAVVELRFTGDVPNPVEDPRGSGIHEKERVVISPGETVDLYSDSFPFGSKIGEDSMGCSPDGNRGEFNVVVETQVGTQSTAKTFAVEYTGSDEMHDCEISISEV